MKASLVPPSSYPQLCESQGVMDKYNCKFVWLCKIDSAIAAYFIVIRTWN